MKIEIDNITLRPDEPPGKIRIGSVSCTGSPLMNMSSPGNPWMPGKKDAIVYRYRIEAVVSDSTGRGLLGNENMRAVPADEATGRRR